MFSSTAKLVTKIIFFINLANLAFLFTHLSWDTYLTISTEVTFFLSGFSFMNIHDSQDNRGISSTPLYHFHLFLRHVDISGEATADSSPQKPSLFNHKLLITNLCRKQSLVSTKTWNFETWEIVTKCFFIPPNLHWKSKFLPAKVS